MQCQHYRSTNGISRVISSYGLGGAFQEQTSFFAQPSRTSCSMSCSILWMMSIASSWASAGCTLLKGCQCAMQLMYSWPQSRSARQVRLMRVLLFDGRFAIASLILPPSCTYQTLPRDAGGPLQVSCTKNTATRQHTLMRILTLARYQWSDALLGKRFV